MSRSRIETVRRCVLGALIAFIFAVTAGAQDTPPSRITVEDLVASLRQSASMGQLATMRDFAAQANAPEALPRLLQVLRDEAPAMDNNTCLAVEMILMQHPDAVCPTEALIEALERKIWTSQQKAAQALLHAIPSEPDADVEERMARALIPLMTNQRSRVFGAGVKCLQRLSGEDHPPTPEPWLAWFEGRFGDEVDLGDAVYEVVAVVRRTPGEDGVAQYSVNGVDVGDAAALETHLAELVDLAAQRDLDLAGVVQVTEVAMAEMAKTMDLSPVEEPIGVFQKLEISGTVSPDADVFRPPWTASVPES
jgi:hypothetical protein